MSRELFKVGPEALIFMGEKTPIVEDTMGIIVDHNKSVGEIHAELMERVKVAQDKAKAQYAALCARTAKLLKDAADA